MKRTILAPPDDKFQVVLRYTKWSKTSVDFTKGGTDGALLELVAKGVLAPGAGYVIGYTSGTSYEITKEANICIREPDVRRELLNRALPK